MSTIKTWTKLLNERIGDMQITTDDDVRLAMRDHIDALTEALKAAHEENTANMSTCKGIISGLTAERDALQANAAIQHYRDSLVAGVVLPELPDADYLGADGVGDIFGYEERHMQDYARQAIADALAKQVPQWQPIETAPKDGTQIVVPSQWSGQDADIASFDTNKSAWFSVKLELLIDPPDCWMPIPAAPDPKEAV